MTIFADIVLDDTITQTDADKVRTQASYAMDAGVYPATIEEAYVKASKSSKAQALHLRVKVGNKYIDQDFWVTGKDGNAYTMKDGEKKPLFGYQPINNLAQLLTGKTMNEMNFAPAMIEDRSYGADAGAMRTVDSAPDFVGKNIKVGVTTIKEFKRAPDANGKWVDTDQTKTFNEMELFFDADTGRTLAEVNSQQPSTFLDEWTKACAGKVIDRTKRRAKN